MSILDSTIRACRASSHEPRTILSRIQRDFKSRRNNACRGRYSEVYLVFIPSPTVYLGLAAAEARCEHMITECYFAIPIIKLFYLFRQRPGRMDDTYNHIPKTSFLPRIQIFLAATFQQLFQLIYLFRRLAVQLAVHRLDRIST